MRSTADADGPIVVPVAASTWEGFRSWARSDDFPRRGRISFVGGELVIDVSPEELETHNKVKTEISAVVATLCRDESLGTFYGDRTLLTHRAAGLATEPDALFASWERLRSGVVRPVARAGHPGEFLELEGSPDWVLEVVSRSSVRKDTVLLRDRYHRAGVREYWLVDARGESVDTRVLVRETRGYAPTEIRDGWFRSVVFARAFRLRRERDPLGYARFRLESR